MSVDLRGRDGHSWATWVDIAALAAAGLALYVVVTGGFRFHLFGFRLSAREPARAVAVSALLVALRVTCLRGPGILRGQRLAARAAGRLTAVAAWRVAHASTVGARVAWRCSPFLPLVAAAVAYVWIPLSWESRKISPVAGDEPHYLIVADAVVHDRTVDVQAAYARDFAARRIHGPIDWRNHSRVGPDGVVSIHGIGVPLLIAAFFRIWGIAGARALLGLLTALLPLMFYRIGRRSCLTRPHAALLAGAGSLGLPFLVASGQVYPDMASGVAILSVFYFLSPGGRTTGLSTGGVLFCGAVIGAVPWLHFKNVAPAALLLGAIAWQQTRVGRVGVSRILGLCLPTVLSLSLLGLYNQSAFGSLLGAYAGAGRLGASPPQALMILLGLHLDQAQGLFIQQPFFLVGVIGSVALWRRSPFLAITLALTYLSVLLPNSLHPAWYGAFSVSGRFMWSGAALWYLPVVALYSTLAARGRSAVVVAAAASLSWQAYLASTWYAEGPGSMYLRWTQDLARRNSLFDGRLRFVLPSFYDFDRYLTYGPNVAALLVLLGLALVGVLGISGSESGRSGPELGRVLARWLKGRARPGSRQ